MSGGDFCPTKQVSAYVQSNGIIRLVGSGMILGRLVDGVDYETITDQPNGPAIQKIREVRDIQDQAGANSYHLGLYNGIELALSIAEDREPKFKSLPLSHMDFGQAIKAVKEGCKITRSGWNGKGMFLIYINPYHNNQYRVTEFPEMVGTLTPYIGMKTADNQLVPWLASHTDILSEDWVVVE